MNPIGELTEALEGSPYLVAADADSAQVIEQLYAATIDIDERCQRLNTDLATQLDARFARSTRTLEIYESNAIEGKLATLRETYGLLEERALWDTNIAVAHYSLGEALRDEPKVRDVVGLGAAKILVNRFAAEPSRPVSENDLREMHALVLAGEPSAGEYKKWINRIEGSAHIPTPPSDVPDAMYKLVRWFRDSEAPLLWRAAAAHAWLTHIHPFEDGNGRMARLLANYVLSTAGYPPLIVKSTSDRGRYISALGHSDDAGDISHLVRVFARAMRRQLTLMESPDFAWKLFERDLQVREESVYKRWWTLVNSFMQEVESQLLLADCRINRVGSVGPSDFELLQRRDHAGNGWLAKISKPGTTRDLLIWVGHTSTVLNGQLERHQTFPAFFLSERNADPRAAKPYLPTVRSLPPLWDELSIITDENRAVVRRGTVVRSVRPAEAAELWAALIEGYLRSLAAEDAG
jgi:Fic family protein